MGKWFCKYSKYHGMVWVWGLRLGDRLEKPVQCLAVVALRFSVRFVLGRQQTCSFIVDLFQTPQKEVPGTWFIWCQSTCSCRCMFENYPRLTIGSFLRFLPTWERLGGSHLHSSKYTMEGNHQHFSKSNFAINRTFSRAITPFSKA